MGSGWVLASESILSVTTPEFCSTLPEDAAWLATAISMTLKSALMVTVPSGCAELPLPTPTLMISSTGSSTMAELPILIIAVLSSCVGILPFDQLLSSCQLAFFFMKQFGENSCAMPVRAKLKRRALAMKGFFMVFGVVRLFIGVGVGMDELKAARRSFDKAWHLGSAATFLSGGGMTFFQHSFYLSQYKKISCQCKHVNVISTCSDVSWVLIIKVPIKSPFL